MLKIITDSGYSLDLPENISIPCKFKNSFFATGIVDADVGYSFQLSDTDNNREALRFMQQLDSTTPFSNTINVTIHFAGGEFLKAVMTIGKNFTARLAVGKSHLLTQLENLKLSDLDFSGVDFDAKENCTTPIIKNEGFFDGLSTWITDNYGGFINASDAGYHAHCWSPQIFVQYFAEKIAEITGYGLKGNFFEDEEIQKLFLYNNTLSKLFSGNFFKVSFDTPDVANYDCFASDTGLTFLKIHLHITKVDTGEVSIIYRNTSLVVPASPTTAPIIWEGFEKNELNLSISGGDVQDFTPGYYNVDVRTVVENSSGSPVTYVLRQSVFGGPVQLATDRISPNSTATDFEFDAKIHAPDVTPKSLLNALITAFCLKFDVKGGNMTLNSRKSILESGNVLDITQYANKNPPPESSGYDGYRYEYTHDSTDSLKSERLVSLDDFNKANVQAAVATFTDLAALSPELNEVRLVEDENVYYIYKVKDDQADPQFTEREWAHFTDNLLGYETDNAKETITAPFSTLLMAMLDGIFGSTDDALVPEINQPGNAPYLNITGKRNGIHFLFDRGGFASHDVYDLDGDVIADYSLRWDGTYGLYNVWWKRFVQFIKNAKKVDSTRLYLPWPILNNYSEQLFGQKLRIGRIEFMMEELTFNLRKYSITDQQAVLYTC